MDKEDKITARRIYRGIAALSRVARHCERNEAIQTGGVKRLLDCFGLRPRNDGIAALSPAGLYRCEAATLSAACGHLSCEAHLSVQ